jgi:gluconokinase
MIVVVMGVAGSGKTTVGTALATRLGWRFIDADDLHPAANVEKMRHGIPLTDEDRAPWLRAVVDAIAPGGDVVLACSALRRWHRDALGEGARADLRFVYLAGDVAELDRRLRARTGHYMSASLLRSQLDTLEPPDATEALTVDAEAPVASIVDTIVRELRLDAPSIPRRRD